MVDSKCLVVNKKLHEPQSHLSPLHIHLKYVIDKKVINSGVAALEQLEQLLRSGNGGKIKNFLKNPNKNILKSY